MITMRRETQGGWCATRGWEADQRGYQVNGDMFRLLIDNGKTTPLIHDRLLLLFIIQQLCSISEKQLWTNEKATGVGIRTNEFQV